MHREALIVLVVLVGVAALFVSNRVRSDLVAVMALLALMLSGVLTVPESLAGFADPVVMVIIAMFIISEALVHTGIAQQIGELVLKTGSGSETRLIAVLMLAVGGVGAFMSSTAAVAIFIPITLSVVDKAGLNRKRLLMPLSVAALISGMMTLIATAPNLVVANALSDAGFEPLAFFSFSPFGITILLVGLVFMLLAGRGMLARARRDPLKRKGRTVRELMVSYGLEDQITRLRVRRDSSLIDRAVARMQIGRNFGLHLTGFEKGPAGHRYYLQAAPETVFDPGDTFLVVGDPDQARKLAMRHSLDVLAKRTDRRRRQKFLQTVGVAEIMLAPDAKFIGKSLEEIQFRSRYNATVLAIRRRGKPVTKDLAKTPLDFGDALLVNAGWPDILSLRDERENFVVLTIPEEFRDVAPARKHSKLALTIIGAMVAAMAFGLLPTVTAAMLAAVLLILSGCVKLESVYQVIDWKSVVLIAGILPLATALNKSGVSQLISVWLVNTLNPLGPLGMLAVVFLVTAITGLFISNTATAVLIAPIAINAAQASGVSPHAFAMTVAIACSAAYVTPVSSPVNTLVREPGGYTFMDFVKVGLPLQLLTLVATILLAWVIYF